MQGVRGVQPPGLTSPLLARARAVPTGRDAAPSSGNVRHPAAALVLTSRPLPLDGLPGHPGTPSPRPITLAYRKLHLP
jgi:hypothetical protein